MCSKTIYCFPMWIEWWEDHCYIKWSIWKILLTSHISSSLNCLRNPIQPLKIWQGELVKIVSRQTGWILYAGFRSRRLGREILCKYTTMEDCLLVFCSPTGPKRIVGATQIAKAACPSSYMLSGINARQIKAVIIM